jgi:hypothetical protein
MLYLTFRGAWNLGLANFVVEGLDHQEGCLAIHDLGLKGDEAP